MAVSTAFAMVASVEGAIDVGHLERLMRLRKGQAERTKLTLPEDNSLAGQRVCDLVLPEDTVRLTVVRGDKVILPASDDALEVGDELLFVAPSAVEEDKRIVDCTTPHGGRPR